MMKGLSRKTLRAWYAANREFADSTIFGLNLKAGYGNRASCLDARAARSKQS
jgi:hypothetical protein